MEKEILILGSTPACIQAAFDLADYGYYVNLMESDPFIGESLGGENASYLKNSRSLETFKHPRIQAQFNLDNVNQTKIFPDCDR